jgi:hypothetical protein
MVDMTLESAVASAAWAAPAMAKAATPLMTVVAMSQLRIVVLFKM